METKIGLLMDLPDDKVPGYYAQIVKALATKVQLFDRDKEMLIVSNEQEAQAALEIMAHYKVETETMELALLPEDGDVTKLWSDYGFESRAENLYFYRKLICPFRFVADSRGSEQSQALLQMEEHLLARYTESGHEVFVVDKQLEELMHGIAKAYRTQIEITD
jgi:hypothetical protein